MRSQNPSHPETKGPPASSPREVFNAASAKSTEIEAKYLVISNDYNAFKRIEDHFIARGLVHSHEKGKQIITRQEDTPDRKLLNEHDTTLRHRYECRNNNLSDLTTADICFKFEEPGNRTLPRSGTLKRKEFEASCALDLDTVDLKPLTDKYTKGEAPELYAVLDSIDPKTLMEHFRIDCIRNRYLVELPEEDTGLKGKKVFMELLLDSVVGVLDLPGIKMPLIFHHDLEVEAEVMFKQCAYDKNPNAARFISSPLTGDEIDQAQLALRRHLYEATSNGLKLNDVSKARRLFQSLDKVYDALDAHIVKVRPNGKLAHAHALDGVDASGRIITNPAPAETPGSIYKLMNSFVDYQSLITHHPVAIHKGPPANTNDLSAPKPKMAG